jgi:hypothetical protein
MVACGALLGCGVSDSSPLVPRQVPGPAERAANIQTTVKTTVVEYTHGLPLTEKRQELDVTGLVGEYHVGDGLGYNLALALKKDQKFDCTWRGCLGVYGRASGDWSVDDKGVMLTPVTSDGMLSGWLDRLQIVAVKNRYLLLQERDRTSLERRGVSRNWCLHRSEDAELVAEEHRAWMKERIEKLSDLN